MNYFHFFLGNEGEKTSLLPLCEQASMVMKTLQLRENIHEQAT